ncbi:hypothetical protein T439DRAFT_355264 [Meredithblackwellia eburnea MCA 4105]
MTKIMKEVLASTSKLSGPVHEILSDAQLVKQGAEAKVYKAILFPTPSIFIPSSEDGSPSTSNPPPPAPVPVLLKYRFAKGYRHATLDNILTRQRLTTEARALVRCLRAGVRVPRLQIVDIRQGVLGLEWIEGWSVREVLGGGQEDDEGAIEEEEEGEDGKEEPEEAVEDEEPVADKLRRLGISEDDMLLRIGDEIAKMHIAEIIHGDLTTSNMMVRLKTTSHGGAEEDAYEVVLIDFGLSSTSPLPEDRAVDLYVLERAFTSTHPVPLLPSGEEGVPHFVRVLDGYRRTIEARGKKGDWDRIEKRLEEVRLRGRKRSMVG